MEPWGAGHVPSCIGLVGPVLEHSMPGHWLGARRQCVWGMWAPGGEGGGGLPPGPWSLEPQAMSPQPRKDKRHIFLGH